MNSLVPKTVPREQDRIFTSLLGRVKGYVPEWNPNEASAGRAVLQVFARYMELLENGLNQVPERGRLAFLDMLGFDLLPAQGARAPLVFSLVENSPVDVTLPARSEVAAQLPPPLPSPSSGGTTVAGSPESVIFSTEQSITLSRAQLKAVYSVLPGNDEFADHTARLAQGFIFFDDLQRCLHAIYLGHDVLFALAGDISVIISVTLAEDRAQSSAPRPALNTEWDYLTDQGWLPLTMEKEDDTTDGWRKDGQMIVRRVCGPNAKQETFEGRTSYWIRGRLTDPLFPDGTGGQRTIPVVNDLRVRVAIHKEGIAPDAAFADAVPLDTSKNFFPFGAQPSQHATFYLACNEVFQRKGAQIQIDLELSQRGKPVAMKLEWEFYDGTGWIPLGITPEMYQFTTEEPLSFSCPGDWVETTVNGTTNYWLRVRISTGDFGFPVRLSLPPTRKINYVSSDGKVLTLDTNQGFTGGETVILRKEDVADANAVVVDRQGGNQIVLSTPAGNFAGGTVGAPSDGIPPVLPGNLQPPVISNISLAYTYTTDSATLDHCLTENDFVLADETEACRWPDRIFTPFRPVADQRPTVHFGFDQPLPAGLISLYIDVPQVVVGEIPETAGSPFIWEYRSTRGWMDLGVLDETLGFRRSGMVQFVGAPDAIRAAGLGGDLIRIRARLKPGERAEALSVGGMWLNAVWAQQSVAIEQEPLGITDGNPDQTLFVQQPPILEGETLEIQEWSGRGERWRLDLKDVNEADLRFEQNPRTKEVTAVWVRWKKMSHFYRATATDRVYIVDRARGIIRLGDGVHGMTPPAGRPARISYRSGEAMNGAVRATVPAGAITEPRMAVPFVQSTINPVAATGGAGTEFLEAVKARGSQRIRHGGRGISAEDLEWLAHEATPEVARARCLSLTGPAGHAQRGWVILIVVPFSPDPEPQPSAETKRRVWNYLVERVPATLSKGIRVTGPRYTRLGVRAEIVPVKPDQAAAVETKVRENLNRFLHPLNGGPDRQGWQFGRPVRLSQIARVIEETIGVDYAAEVVLMSDGHLYEDLIPVDPDGLIASGDHELKLTVGVR